jgi:hypothetical protein
LGNYISNQSIIEVFIGLALHAGFPNSNFFYRKKNQEEVNLNKLNQNKSITILQKMAALFSIF